MIHETDAVQTDELKPLTYQIDRPQTEIIKPIAGQVIIIPRLLRLRDAPAYLGMDRHYFNETVRPTIKLISIGKQGIAVDRLDLDAWVMHTKQRSGRPAASNHRSVETWDEKERQGSIKRAKTGKLIKSSSGVASAKALAQTISKKLKNTSPGDWKA